MSARMPVEVQSPDAPDPTVALWSHIFVDPVLLFVYHIPSSICLVLYSHTDNGPNE